MYACDAWDNSPWVAQKIGCPRYMFVKSSLRQVWALWVDSLVSIWIMLANLVPTALTGLRPRFYFPTGIARGALQLTGWLWWRSANLATKIILLSSGRLIWFSDAPCPYSRPQTKLCVYIWCVVCARMRSLIANTRFRNYVISKTTK